LFSDIQIFDICTVVGQHWTKLRSTRQKQTLEAMAQNVALLGLALIAITSVVALPVTQNKKEPKVATTILICTFIKIYSKTTKECL